MQLHEHIGAVARLSRTYDAGLVEVIASIPDIVAIGAPRPPLVPIVSLNVQKSGATTGLTFSTVAYTNALIFAFHQLAVGGQPWPGTDLFFVYNSTAGIFPLFAWFGDSGSLVVAGWPLNMLNFGTRVNALLKRLNPVVATALRFLLARSALGLVLGGVPRTFADPTGFIVALEIQPVLDDLNVDLV